MSPIASSVNGSSSNTRKRPYGQSCTACREKKISCDRAQPKCKGCSESGEECRIPTPARPLRRLMGPGASADRPNETVEQLSERVRRLEERLRYMEDMLHVPVPSAPQSPLGSSHRDLVDDSNAKYKLTVDDSGNVMYHGLTSWNQATQDALADDSSFPTALPADPTDPSNTNTSTGMTDPAFAPFFQAIASAKHISVAPELGDALVDTYFATEVFAIVHRPTFLRDMALGGPMFSEFLLMAVYSSATRKIDGLAVDQRQAQGELFERLAKEYLAKEMEGPSKITTVQGLLLLSGKAAALGSVTQGWNYAGLAFRMMQDLGIHLPPSAVAGSSKLSAEEQTARDRLFWSAFIWDKVMSLALGREPTFPPRPGRDPSTIPDFEDDDEPWTPFYVNPANCPWSLVGYSYRPKRRATAFRACAKLCVILHHLINELYTHDSRSSAIPRHRLGFITRTRQKLDKLYAEDIPDDMKFRPDDPPSPSYVFMFEMLYRASYILLYRPTFDPSEIASASGNVATCLEHSIAMNQMSLKFTQTFGERLTYPAMYASFVAAMFDMTMLDAIAVEVQMPAFERLQRWLSIMAKTATKSASIKWSVDHISSLTSQIVARHPVLAASDAGQRLLAQHYQPDLPPAAELFDPSSLNFFDFSSLA